MYEESRIGFDIVIISIFNKKLRVVLKKREKPPFKELLELPGGLLTKDETIESCMERKLKDFFLHNIYFKQLYTFTEPKRDSRSRTISVSFIAIVDYDKALKIRKPDYFSNDSDCWYPVNRILKTKLAFDHLDILKKAISNISHNFNKELASQFLPSKFPLNKLQEIFSIILNKHFDNRNFRKMALKKYVHPTNEFQTKVGHRPAKLYRIIN
jgi:8-oxo-dGTP diphosphatase